MMRPAPAPAPASTCLPIATAMDLLCPMHLRLDTQGQIQHLGPTLQKLIGDRAVKGQIFWDVFELVRPTLADASDFGALMGRSLQFRIRGDTQVLRGLIVQDSDGWVFNLSFGIGILDAVGRHHLTSLDFAVTDLTTEMLYLHEAQSAIMEESQNLISRLQGAMIAAEEQAFTDTLTGLKNRRALDHVMQRMIDLGEDFACMHLDLDFFKAVNDTLGHAAGDHVLQEAAKIMVKETRSQDTIARVGGDEFVILLKNITDPKVIHEVAKRIIARIEHPIPWHGQMCKVSSSAGSTITRSYADPDKDQVLHHADVALYASKKAGRAQHHMYDTKMEMGEVSTSGTP